MAAGNRYRPPVTTTAAGWPRSILSLSLGLITTVAVLASVLGYWAQASIYDSEAVGRAVDAAMRDPEVIDALAEYLTDQIMAAAEVEARVETQLEGSRLASNGPMVGRLLAAGARSQIHTGMTHVLSHDATRRAVVEAARQSHGQLVQILDSGQIGTVVRVADGTVTLNLLPVMGRGFAMVQEAGLLRNVDLPNLERTGDPAEQIRDLELALGRPLPPDFGQLVVYEGAAVNRAESLVAQIQQALAIFHRSLLAVQVIAVGSAVGTILLARRRLRSLGYLATGIVCSMAVGRALIRAALAAAPSVAANPGARATIARIVNTLASGLVTAVTVTLLTSLLVAAAALAADREGSLSLALKRNREVVTAAAAGLLVAVLWSVGATPVGLTLAGLVAAAMVVAAWLPARSASRPLGDVERP